MVKAKRVRNSRRNIDDNGGTRDNSKKYITTGIVVFVGYIILSLYWSFISKKALKNLISENIPGVTVTDLNLDGFYLVNNVRKGIAVINKNGTPFSIEVTVSGNGLWNDAFVEISGQEVFKLRLR